jgi:hypothetical protein
MKRFFFAFAWLLLTTGVILTSAGAFIFYRHTAQPTLVATELDGAVTGVAGEGSGLEQQGPRGEVKGVTTQFQTGDARPAIVASFLERYNSPLQPYDEYGALFVEIADHEGIDFRLLPAIAMQESNLCKRIPPGSYNCLGFGVHSRGTLGFESYEANFRRAARELKANYINQGLTTPSQIMTKYTPGSNGSWANSVNQWMAEMRYNDRDAGREKKRDGSVLEFVE